MPIASDSVREKFASTIGGSWDTVTQKVGFATQAWEEQIVAIMDEWDANTAASDDKLRRIDELRAAYAKLKEARKAAEAFRSGDRKTAEKMFARLEKSSRAVIGGLDSLLKKTAKKKT